MIDELYDRHYRESRAELNSAFASMLERFGSAVLNAFKVLNRIEYSAPWATRPRRARPQ